MESNKQKIINRKYSTNVSMLVIDVFIEQKENGFIQEVIFFEISHYKVKTKITMLLDVLTLRALSLALLKYINNIDAQFKKYSQSGGSKKSLSIGISGKKVFINIDEKEDSGKFTKLEYIFGLLGAESFAMELEDICKFTNDELFNIQKNFFSKDIHS